MPPLMGPRGDRLRVGHGRRRAQRLHRRRAPAGHAARRPDRAGGRRALRPTRRTRRRPPPRSALPPDRSYADYREMARAEAARPDGIEAVVIVTPNHLHAPIATAFLEAGIDVICDKPLSTTLAEAEALVALTRARQAQVRRDAQQYRLRHGPAGARDGGGRRARPDRRRAWHLHPGLADAADRRRRPEAGRVAHRSGTRRPIGGACRYRRACVQPRLLHLGRARPRRSRPICSPPCPGGGSTTMRMCWCAGRAARAARSWRARPRPATTTISRCASMATRPAWNGRRRGPKNCASRAMARKRARWCAAAMARPGEPPRVAHAGRASRGLYRGLRQSLSRCRRDHPRPSHGRCCRSGARRALCPMSIDGARGVKFVAAAVASSSAGGAWTPALFG